MNKATALAILLTAIAILPVMLFAHVTRQSSYLFFAGSVILTAIIQYTITAIIFRRESGHQNHLKQLTQYILISFLSIPTYINTIISIAIAAVITKLIHLL